jgi:FkbM family methyltransferase
MLNDASVVYSVGIGEDISFDLELIERLRVKIHAFDPTPKSVAWLNAQNLPREFIFHPIGVSDLDGVAKFYPPRNPKFVSQSLRYDGGVANKAIILQVRRLSTIMAELQHPQIDLLKLDIEGAEYQVLEDLTRSSLPIGQIVVEFHHGRYGISIEETRNAIENLCRNDYRIFSISENEVEYSFVRTGAAKDLYQARQPSARRP